MSKQSSRLRRAVGAVAVAAVAAGALAVGVGGMAGAGATGSVRGFDGTTIKLAGLGIKAQFANAATGAEARVKRFNDTNEIKGVKLDYTEFADDKQDPATALSEARRLVTQDQVFAIVGDVSQFNPADYFKQQQVPFFGFAFDAGYCSTKPDTSLWGFGYNGCLVNPAPSVMGDQGANPYTYAAKATGKKNPTLAMFANDTTSGKNAVKFQSIPYAAAGFDVVAKLNEMPAPPISDYTPYAQSLLTSDNGKAPDAILCLLSTDCIQIWSQLQANGYKGVFFSSLYSDFLTKSMNGTVANALFNPVDAGGAGMKQLQTDVDAVTPGSSTKVDSGMVAGYASTDMFIQALKSVAKKGKSSITPAAVQKAAMNQTWQMKGLAGPTQYPNATVASYQACSAEVLSDGTAWKTVVPYTCSKKQYPVKGAK
jgi:ABC-type branched-subunit amino acid transport system substrate-binding protein